MLKYDVFVSYNRKKDRTWARALIDRLRKSGLKPFFDEDVGLAGAALSDAINQAIFDSRCFLILLTPASVRSGWVGKEKQTALAIDPDAKRRFVIPLLVKNCTVPADLRSIGYVDCRGGLGRSEYRALLAAVRQRPAVELDGDGEPTDRWHFRRTPIATNLANLVFVNQFDGWAVGDEGTVLSTADGGRSWRSHGVPTNASLYDLAFSADGVKGWACGQGGVLIQTSNGGAKWACRTTGVESDLNSITVCEHDEAICVVGRDGVMLRGGTDGKTLRRIRLNSLENLWSVYFSRVGEFGCVAGSHGTVFLSKDGGRKWDQVNVPVRASFYDTFVMNDNRTVWVVGEDGCILVSADRGKKWVRRPLRGLGSGWDDWLNGIAFSPDQSKGWIVGAHGLLVNTSDAGRTWSVFRLREPIDMRNIRYQQDGTAWVAGAHGVVLATA